MTTVLVNKIIKHAHHRNGVSCEPFHAVIFEANGDTMLGIVFDDSPGYCAVFDLNRLAEQRIEFGDNSWRGDAFEPALRAALED